MTARSVSVLVVASLAVAVCASSGCASGTTARPPAPAAGPPSPVDSAVAFLDRYEQPDGRVVRIDQGGDTVSEGQSYAMLLAVVANDRARFDAAWSWAVANLARADHLWSWRWQGSVVDPMPASDADLDAAWALSLAATRFGDARYSDGARQMAASIAQEETAAFRGAPLLVAGPWATSPPATVEIGYLAPAAFASLATVDPAGPWTAMVTSGRAALSSLTMDGARLPADWAVVDADSLRPVSAAGATDGTGTVGLDALRTLAWFGASCESADRALVAPLAPLVADQPGATQRNLDGSAPKHDEHAAALVAAAIADDARGQTNDGTALLVRAADVDRATPTYYGSAWVALASALRTSGSALRPCPA